MNSRRSMPTWGVPPPVIYRRGQIGRRRPVRSVCRTFSLPQKRQQVLGPDLNCSESRWGAAEPSTVTPRKR